MRRGDSPEQIVAERALRMAETMPPILEVLVPPQVRHLVKIVHSLNAELFERGYCLHAIRD